jgi:hypothetical protein
LQVKFPERDIKLSKNKGGAEIALPFLFSLLERYQHFPVAGIQVLSPFADTIHIALRYLYRRLWGCGVPGSMHK